MMAYNFQQIFKRNPWFAGRVVSSEGQEKYLRELSITPVGYFTGAIKNHSCAVSHRHYFAWRK
jgi:hypothetical protein